MTYLRINPDNPWWDTCSAATDLPDWFTSATLDELDAVPLTPRAALSTQNAPPVPPSPNPLASALLGVPPTAHPAPARPCDRHRSQPRRADTTDPTAGPSAHLHTARVDDHAGLPGPARPGRSHRRDLGSVQPPLGELS